MDTVHPSLLACTPPYALGASIRALSGFAPCAGDQTVDGDQIRKAFALSTSEAVVAEGAPRPDTEPGGALRVVAPRGLSSAETTRVQRQGSHRLGLDDDPAPFLGAARRGPRRRAVLAATHRL